MVLMCTDCDQSNVMISRLVMLCLIALLAVCIFYIIEMENNCSVLYIHVYVHDCDLMETQKIEEALLVLYREHTVVNKTQEYTVSPDQNIIYILVVFGCHCNLRLVNDICSRLLQPTACFFHKSSCQRTFLQEFYPRHAQIEITLKFC